MSEQHELRSTQVLLSHHAGAGKTADVARQINRRREQRWRRLRRSRSRRGNPRPMPASFRPAVVLSLRQQNDIHTRLSAVELLDVPWRPYSVPMPSEARWPSAVIFI